MQLFFTNNSNLFMIKILKSILLNIVIFVLKSKIKLEILYYEEYS